jgi:hypothetical protein
MILEPLDLVYSSLPLKDGFPDTDEPMPDGQSPRCEAVHYAAMAQLYSIEVFLGCPHSDGSLDSRQTGCGHATENIHGFLALKKLFHINQVGLAAQLHTDWTGGE